MPNHLDQRLADFQNILDHFQKELQSLRTGRASIAMVEDIKVETYGGQTMELKTVASITTPDAKTVQIEPWDKTIVKDIEKALVDASLGMQPNVAGTVIRMIVPPMTEENRTQLVKVLHQKEEQAKIGIRNVREKIKSAITQDEKDKTISEDEKRRELERLDKTVAQWNGKIDEATKKKEQEILTI